MFPCFVEIADGGKYEYWNSENITTPKCKLPPHIALKQDIYEEIAGPIIFKMAPWEPL